MYNIFITNKYFTLNLFEIQICDHEYWSGNTYHTFYKTGCLSVQYIYIYIWIIFSTFTLTISLLFDSMHVIYLEWFVKCNNNLKKKIYILHFLVDLKCMTNKII